MEEGINYLTFCISQLSNNYLIGFVPHTIKCNGKVSLPSDCTTYSFNRLQLKVFNLSEEIQSSEGRQDVCDEGCLTLVPGELLQPLQVTLGEVKLQLRHAEAWEQTGFG